MTLSESLAKSWAGFLLDSPRLWLSKDSRPGLFVERGLECLVKEGNFLGAFLYRESEGELELLASSGHSLSPGASDGSPVPSHRTERLLHCLRSASPLSLPPEHYLPVPGASGALGVLLLVSREEGDNPADMSGELAGVPALFALGISFGTLLGEVEAERGQGVQGILEAFSDALFVTGGSGSVLRANAAGLDLVTTGSLPPPLHVGPVLSDLSSGPSQGADWFSLLREKVGTSEEGGGARLLQWPDASNGEGQTLAMTRRPLGRQGEKEEEFLVTVRNVTPECRHADIVERYRLIFERAQEGIVITDRNLSIIDINPSFTRVTGYARGEILGKTPALLKSGRQTTSFYERMWESLARSGHWEGEIWDRKKSGEIYCEWLSISSIETDGAISHYLGIFSDITEHMKDKERILHLATHDVLTDLPNRRIFKERIEEACRSHQRTGNRFAVGILDLDGFKSVNDRLGHQCGDTLLVKVAERLLNALRETDMLARLGGDEFGLLLTNLSAADSDLPDFFSRIVDALHAPFDLEVEGGEGLSITGSLGLTLCPPEEPRPEVLLSHADLALYRGKERGKDRWFLFESQMSDSLEDQHRIHREFEQALSRREIVLHYQPQVGLEDGTILGVEALARWNHPEKGLLFPDSFIDIVEKTPLVMRLGRLVLELALEQKRQWHEAGLDLRISVNVGALHFLSGSFGQDIEDLLRTHFPGGDFPGGLVIEITEREVFRDLSLAQKVAEFCHERGILLSLDDFGTGQASLTALQKLPVREIKIDRGFVQKIHQGEKDRAIVASLLATGQMMKIDVVAEGLETQEVGTSLISMGCRWAQGFGIARPMPPSELPGWIRGWSPPWGSVAMG